ncbi:MAG: SIMPL domain-containing protein [Acidocella sp.]|nr:SIMPL domain-containing protein [Acidocella sp.]
MSPNRFSCVRPALALALSLALTAIGPQAHAQPPAKAAQQTELSLAATGEATVPPDETVATLTAQSTGSSAADVQAAVNQMVATALGSAAHVKNLVATTGDYNVVTTNDGQGQPTGYQATQSLSLTMQAVRGAPPPVFLTLIGHLQAQALQLQSLGAVLSDTGRAHAEKIAILAAVHKLQDQATAIAGSLGAHVTLIKTLNVSDSNAASPMPDSRMMMATATPAQDQPGPIIVQAHVTAMIELTP